jgi:hypothetical protein
MQSYRPGSSGAGLGRYDRSGREIDWRTRQTLARIEADRSVTRAVVDRRIEETTRHNPNLEYGCREIETVFVMAAAQHIARYMTRER